MVSFVPKNTRFNRSFFWLFGRFKVCFIHVYPFYGYLSHSCPKHVVIEKKSPSEFDNKIENCSHQTTIFHWNWKEKLRFVGFITWLTQPIRPKLGGNFCRCTTSPPTNLNFSFQFQWKMVVWWLQFTILLSNVLGLFFSITTCLGQLWPRHLFLFHTIQKW